MNKLKFLSLPSNLKRTLEKITPKSKLIKILSSNQRRGFISLNLDPISEEKYPKEKSRLTLKIKRLYLYKK